MMLREMTVGHHRDVVGRERELRAAAEALDERPPPSAVLFEEEAGSGKTTLLQASLAHATRRGYRVLAASPAGKETQFSYAALRDLLADAVEEALPELPGPQRRALQVALLLEEPEGAPVERPAVVVAFLNAVRSLARKDPLAIAVDDLHWIDPERSEERRVGKECR